MKIIKKLSLMAAAMLVLLTLTGCGKDAENVQSGNKVVCSFYPEYVMAADLLSQTEVEVINMTSGLTGCIHDYQLTTKDIKALEGADVLITNGKGMEGFLNKVSSNYPKLSKIALAELVTEAAKIDNPHIWTDPFYAYDMYTALYAELLKVYPDKEEQLKGAYIVGEKKLDELCDIFVDFSDMIVGENFSVICYNEAFEIYAEALGIPILAVFSLDEDEKPSAQEIAKCIERAAAEKTMGTKVYVFVEKEFEKEAAAVVEATGAKVIYTSPLTSGMGTLESFVADFLENLENFKNAVVR